MRIWKKESGWTNPKENNRKNLQDQQVSAQLDQNLDLFKEIMGNAQDLIIREFTIASDDEVNAAVIAIEGLVDRDLVNEQVLANLMLDIRFRGSMDSGDIYQRIKKYGISNMIIKEESNISNLVNEILSGNTVIIINGENRALFIDSRGWKDRPVSEPVTEGVVRGSRDGFTETIRTNVALIRRRIKSPDLRINGFKVGERTQTDVVVMYLDGVAKPEIIDEVKRRLHRIKIDGVLESGYIEELIEDSPFSPFPQVEHSERPDKVAGAILEGRIAILVDTTPFVLMVPTVFFQFIQSSEDYYERFYMGSVIRLVRMLAYLIAITLPAFYIALTSFHQEMIPTPLAMSIAASREGVPFPAIGEALLMEATFEILREAGIRLPRPTGQAVSIVGALVIGQAAVQAGIVSQSMVIIVAITGISSFAIPAYNAAIAGRLLRFPLMILASVLGLFGILAGLGIIVAHMIGLRSFGVNYMSPVTSAVAEDLKDVIVRSPWWALRRRPGITAGADKIREQNNRKPPGSEHDSNGGGGAS